MKLNIADPTTGAQKLYEIEDERRMRVFYDKRISQEVEGDSIADQFKGYVFKITGGHDKQGFAMYQGVMAAGRVRLLLNSFSKNNTRGREGSRKRKSVRGCICGPDLSVIHVIIAKKGDNDLEGLTDRQCPLRLGPKRASKIRKLFGLTKEDDVRKFVVRRKVTRPSGKTFERAPKIQRLVTPSRLQRKRRTLLAKKQHRIATTEKRAKYAAMLAERRSAAVSKKRTVKA
nr:40S ribosomal protein S6 [Seculamonas ecuadoriensis]